MDLNHRSNVVRTALGTTLRTTLRHLVFSCAFLQPADLELRQHVHEQRTFTTKKRREQLRKAVVNGLEAGPIHMLSVPDPIIDLLVDFALHHPRRLGPWVQCCKPIGFASTLPTKRVFACDFVDSGRGRSQRGRFCQGPATGDHSLEDRGGYRRRPLVAALLQFPTDTDIDIAPNDHRQRFAFFLSQIWNLYSACSFLKEKYLCVIL